MFGHGHFEVLLNLDWHKSNDTKRKNAKIVKVCFCTKSHKKGIGNICDFFVITLEPLRV